MPRVLSRSIWVKLVVLVVAIAGFVLLYEAQMLDSLSVAWISMATSTVARHAAAVRRHGLLQRQHDGVWR